jgi:type I restriction enzyme S subunit
MLLSTPMRHMIMSMGNGFIRINLRAEKLITLPILLPTFTEQQEIADYLDKKCNGIDQLISIKQQKIVELKDYKKSLIYEYTTGKKEVKL